MAFPTTTEHAAAGDIELPPGTIYLVNRRDQRLILDPKPSDDPNDPLNWSFARKSINLLLTIAVTAIVFTILSIQTVLWQLMIPDLKVDYSQLNNASAINYAGTGAGCIFFIPFAVKYGRRPVYLVSTAMMAAMSFWSARMTTVAELYITNLLAGLAGSTNETIVQMTIADLFFVHQHGGANALYLVGVSIGSFCAPIATGFQSERSGWRWPYWSCGITASILFVLFLIFYEETKYTPILNGMAVQTSSGDGHPAPVDTSESSKSPECLPQAAASCDKRDVAEVRRVPTVEQARPVMRTYSQRLRFVTPTDENLFHVFTGPLKVFFSLPAVSYTGVQYGFALCWLAAMMSVQAITMPYPPYNFTPNQIGMLSLAPFIGTLIGTAYGGPFCDWSIVRWARRNQGFYEPEMRIYNQHLPTISMAAGILTFGLTLSKEMRWVYPAAGTLIFGFGFGATFAMKIPMTMDSYPELVGEAFVGIAFVRNAFSVAILFALSPWMEAQGMSNMFIVMGCWCLFVALLYIPMIYLGKRFRIKSLRRYERLVEEHSTRRH